MEFQKWLTYQQRSWPELTPERGKRIFDDERVRNSMEELGLSSDEICELPIGTLLFVGAPERFANVKMNVERLLYYFTKADVFLLLVDYPVAFAEDPHDFDEALFDIMVFVGTGWPTAVMKQYWEGDRDHSIFREMIGRTLYPESWFAALEQLGEYIEAE